MRCTAAIAWATVFVVFCGCSGGSTDRPTGPSASRPIGTSFTSTDRIETISLYGERLLGQSFAATPPGAVAKLKVCVPQRARPQLVRARDYQLVLPNGRRIAATSGAVSPALHDGQIKAGACTAGFLTWDVASDQHPRIVDTRTRAGWKPNCPRSTASTSPCIDPAPR